MPALFDPLTIRGVTLRNRIGVSPMCQYSSIDGLANDWHLVHLGSRAVGGAGLVMVEATAVEARGRISPDDMGIYADKHVEPLARIARFVRGQGATPGIQLAHAGRKASRSRPWDGDAAIPDAGGGWPIIGPDAVPFGPGERVPSPMSVDDIGVVLESFRAAVRRAVAAGFEWIELHAAHGYLCHSFYSPLSNSRTDSYGGSFDKRIRFTLEAFRAIRETCPDSLPVAVRISCTDWVDAGWTIEDSVALSIRLKNEGADLIDCSSGGVIPGVSIPSGAGYQVPLSEAIRRAGMTTAAVGMINEPMQADEIVRNGRADMVFLGREELRNPYWPFHAARVLHKTAGLAIPPQYRRAISFSSS